MQDLGVGLFRLTRPLRPQPSSRTFFSGARSDVTRGLWKKGSELLHGRKHGSYGDRSPMNEITYSCEDSYWEGLRPQSTLFAVLALLAILACAIDALPSELEMALTGGYVPIP